MYITYYLPITILDEIKIGKYEIDKIKMITFRYILIPTLPGKITVVES